MGNMGSLLLQAGSLDGGRCPRRRFSIPEAGRMVASRLGLAPAVITEGMKDWEAVPKEIHSARVGRTLANYLF
ncbi:MAG: hypothetical protein AB7T27_03885 [Kiritimatiellia bacterium]